MSFRKSHGKSIRGADFPGVNSVQKGVSLPKLQSTRVSGLLSHITELSWMDCRGSLPNTPKSKEKESSLFSSINQLLDKWIYRRSQVLMERFFFFFCCRRRQE